ncbi:amino acid adenylation domain-containing protein [Streptomyces sp. NPDC101733]|uniref:non-ribosomal peptide synthetase n=1 Tax=unclassified Streptomyces TaxID=2593676 RepID=UPI00382FB451
MRSFGASPAHKGLWLAEAVSDDTLNHALTMWDVDGALDAAAMESAFLHVLGEAEVLRVTFDDDGSGLRQIPRELGDWRPFFLDFSAESDPEQAARDALAAMLREPFDLKRDLLFRMGVVTLSADRSLVVITYHHLISDGFGTGGLLSRRFAEAYTALVRGERVPELPYPWDVEPVAAEAQEYLDSPQFTADKEFWRTYLADAPAPAQVPRVALSRAETAALSEPMNNADRWGELTEPIGMVSRTLTVARAEADTWTESAKSLGVWMSQLLSAAAAVYFRHRCDRPEFLISLAVGNRIGVASRTPGLAVNVAPVRVKVPLTATFAEIADAMVDETYDLFDHTACHYSDIQRASGTVLSRRASFGAVINVVDFVEQLRFGDSAARYLGGTTGAFEELAIGVYNDGTPDSDLFIRLDAPAGLYTRAELRFIGEELIDHIRAVVADSDKPVGALDVLAGDARARVLKTPDATTAPTALPTVTELFAHRVERAPDAVALVAGDATLSYRELDERSDRLAAALRRRDVGPETVVAVALPRSVDLAVALLGVVKAGGAYLPVDPSFPAARLKPAVADAAARLLLTDAATAGALSTALDLPAVVFDALGQDGGEDTDTPAPALPTHQDGLLAVTYGSDTAGATTSVAVPHRTVARIAADPRWRQAGQAAVLWHAPATHDALALELWLPLLNGGRVVLAPAGETDLDSLTALRAAHDIGALWLPADLFSEIAAQNPASLAGLRQVWTGGERVPAAAVHRVREACPDLTIVNGHGPAETTGFAAVQVLDASTPAEHTGSLGRPSPDTALYVLGPGLAPVPTGVVGELYVAGPRLARGHAGRPERTAQYFVPCPFGPAGALMYRTGDRVRLTAGGRLEHVGRADGRTDVRGVRVELAEAEEALAAHTDLARAAVVVKDDTIGQPRLVAYVVPAAGKTVTAEELRRFAAAALPEPLVPAVFISLERLPVTAGGRLDRASLPEPEFDDKKYRAPRNDTEKVLAALFADVLELDRVGIDEDFFDLGGNSLRAIRLVGLIRAQLKQEVSIRRLFAARTIIGLSDMWKDLARSSRPGLKRRTREGAVL